MAGNGRKSAPKLSTSQVEGFVSPRAGTESSPLPPKPAAQSEAKITETPQTKKMSAVINASETDKAVDEISASDSDELLAAQDAAARQEGPKVHGTTFKAKVIKLLKNKWTWITIGSIAGLIFLIPATRYTVLGLVFKREITVVVTDSKTATPVSNAEVSVDGVSAKTEGNGEVKFKAPLGNGTLKVSKQYYASVSQSIFVGIKSSGPVLIKLVATGRQVPVKVINTITSKPLSGVEIKVQDTTAKTDSNGLATIVLPTKESEYQATLTFTAYNEKTATITVTDQLVSTNTFNLTPVGKIYYLNNSSGKIDVVKSNLDGTDKSVVLAGTGTEDPNNTSLLATRDWSFLVLKAQRNGSAPALYVIDTSTDRATQFDGALRLLRSSSCSL